MTPLKIDMVSTVGCHANANLWGCDAHIHQNATRYATPNYSKIVVPSWLPSWGNSKSDIFTIGGKAHVLIPTA
jgi:hypothetical protein